MIVLMLKMISGLSSEINFIIQNFAKLELLIPDCLHGFAFFAGMNTKIDKII